MRIPANSCEGCNKDATLMPTGVHAMGNGLYSHCEFIKAELLDFNPGLTLHGAYTKRIAAVRSAKKRNAALLWVGQGPVEMWLVVS